MTGCGTAGVGIMAKPFVKRFVDALVPDREQEQRTEKQGNIGFAGNHPAKVKKM